MIMEQVLVHLASGIGNIVLSTPLLIALEEMGFSTDVRLAADYPQTADLLSGWSAVHEVFTGSMKQDPRRYRHILPAIPPFYWHRFSQQYRGIGNLVPRPQDDLFYRDEQSYYLAFARALGYESAHPPLPRLPIAADDQWGVTAATVALAPGCKTGEMTAKRWPHFAELARRLSDVAVVGTPDDIGAGEFPPHARSFIGKLTLRQTAELMAAAGAVVANDSGLAHIAAAVGTPTLMIFGPTPSQTLGRFAPHVSILSLAMECQPCWYTAPLRACERRVDCLRAFPAERVYEELVSIGQIERTQ
jgi:ADP-heptose:LPS heptosyltransferase